MTYNVFGFPLPDGVRNPCMYHLKEGVDIKEQLGGRNCTKNKSSCFHHYPMDEFELWVYETCQKDEFAE